MNHLLRGKEVLEVVRGVGGARDNRILLGALGLVRVPLGLLLLVVGQGDNGLLYASLGL